MPTPTHTHPEFLAAQERHRKLATQATRLEVEIEAATKQVQLLEAEAFALFGTSDIAKLTDILAQRQAANESRKASFIQAVSQLETELDLLRASFAAS